MGAANLKIDIKGINAVKKTLEKLPEELRKSSQSAVLRAGGKPILKREKSKVPVADGLLKKSLGIMLVGKGIKSAVKIGVRKGYKGRSLGFKESKRGKTKGQMTERFQDPSNYSHLVEFGTSHSAAKPFIRPAIDEAQGEVIDAMAAGLDKHLTRVAARLAKR
jgi:HK97 gp10 family phage protein